MSHDLELAKEMARAIMRDRIARSSSKVGRDGRQRVTFQHMQAMKQMDEAMAAFCAAIDMPVEIPSQYTDAEALREWAGVEMPRSEGGHVDLLTPLDVSG